MSSDVTDPPPVLETSEDVSDEPKNSSDEYVIYQTEPEEKDLSPYELDKEMGQPHPFVDPASSKPIEEPRTSEDLWWNWRKPDEEQWSRWQRRRPDVDTVSLAQFMYLKINKICISLAQYISHGNGTIFW